MKLETNWKIQTLASLLLEHFGGWQYLRVENGTHIFKRGEDLLRMEQDTLKNLVENKELIKFYA